MPELPEVETVARQLRPRLTGRKVLDFRVLDPLLRRGPMPRLGGGSVIFDVWVINQEGKTVQKGEWNMLIASKEGAD